ncbi:hypothetical protein Hanom_Chr16g01502071 [Helianthus anomalus]
MIGYGLVHCALILVHWNPITSDTTPTTFLSLSLEYWVLTWHDLIGCSHH